MLSGLLGKTSPPKMKVVEMPGKGRGVVGAEHIKEGSYVLEYKAEVYPRKERAAREREYSANGEGCYILDTLTRDGWVCLDATRRLSSAGRLLNHAPKSVATLTPFKPLFVRGKWRVGFVATRDLSPGEELTWDYGCQPGGVDWLRRKSSANVG